MRKIGYIRVSSKDQNQERQIRQLNAGDTIYVTDLTRITRNTQGLFSLIDQIKDKKRNSSRHCNNILKVCYCISRTLLL